MAKTVDELLEAIMIDQEKNQSFDLIPAPVKALGYDVLFNSLLPGKLQNKITYDNDFFAASDLAFIREKVLERIKKTGKKKGTFEYKHYPSGDTSVERRGGSVTDIFLEPEERVKKTLGQFGYELKDDKIMIGDRFNFNDAPQDRQNIPLSEKLKTITADIDAEKLESNYGKVRKAAQHLGSPEGQGATFKLEIDASN
jgi:hypothetical protein